MNDNDLRALAAKLLKHYVADQNPVAEELVAQIPLDRMPAKVVPLITAEQRALLDQLGGAWAGIHESKAVALIAQGCGGCGGGGDGGGDGGGGDGGGDGGGGDGGGDGGDGDGDGDDDGDDDDGEDPDAPSPNAAPASTSFSSWDAMMNALGVSPANAPADPNAATAPDSISISTAQSANPDVSNMTDAEMEANLNASIATATAAANAAAPSSSAAPGAATGAATGSSTGAPGGNAAGADNGGLGGIAGGIAGALGEAFGVGSAAAADFNPANSGMAAIQDAARAAAAQGQYSQFISNPNYAAAIDPALHAQLSAQSNMVNSQNVQSTSSSVGPYGSLAAMSASPVAMAPAINPYGTLTMSPQQAQQAELSGQIGMIGATQSANAPASQTTMTTATTPDSWAAGATGANVGNMTGQFTTAGPVGTSAVADPYAGMTAVGPAAPSQVAAASPAPGSLTSSVTVQGPTVSSPTSSQDQGSSYTVSGPLSGTLAGLTSGATGTAPGSTTDTGSGGGGTEVIRPLTPITPQSIDLATFDPTATPGVTAPGTSADATAALRKYLGLTGDPTKYGFGAEQQFYSTPTAAKGGYFDATQYFADGGMVQPLSPPTTPLVSAQPTMAFTDGAGAVGNIAQPPGLAPSDAYGSDAPHASPMAPSIAAAVPTMQPGLATLAVPNVNAAPVTSQVSQNPNVGYALGNSPLSNLTRS